MFIENLIARGMSHSTRSLDQLGALERIKLRLLCSKGVKCKDSDKGWLFKKKEWRTRNTYANFFAMKVKGT